MSDLQETRQEASKTEVVSSPQKRRPGKRSSLLTVGVLGLFLLLVFAVTFGFEKKTSNTALVTSYIATATATARTPDVVRTPLGTVSPWDEENLKRFAYGTPMYWANMRYHQLTGHWVPWPGNADQWPSQAAAYGWTVSTQPHIPSIMAFQPYVQGAGPHGHVAIAESIDGDDVITSHWDVSGYPLATTIYLRNQAGAGVSFLYYSGS